MKPHQAARRFARIVTSYGDFLSLVDPDGTGEEKIKKAVAKVERAVWRAEKMKPRDTIKLFHAAEKSVPKPYRKKLLKALVALDNAETSYLLVREQTAYLIGLQMGRRLRRG